MRRTFKTPQVVNQSANDEIYRFRCMEYLNFALDQIVNSNNKFKLYASYIENLLRNNLNNITIQDIQKIKRMLQEGQRLKQQTQQTGQFINYDLLQKKKYSQNQTRYYLQEGPQDSLLKLVAQNSYTLAEVQHAKNVQRIQKLQQHRHSMLDLMFQMPQNEMAYEKQFEMQYEKEMEKELQIQNNEVNLMRLINNKQKLENQDQEGLVNSKKDQQYRNNDKVKRMTFQNRHEMETENKNEDALFNAQGQKQKGSAIDNHVNHEVNNKIQRPNEENNPLNQNSFEMTFIQIKPKKKERRKPALPARLEKLPSTGSKKLSVISKKPSNLQEVNEITVANKGEIQRNNIIQKQQQKQQKNFQAVQQNMQIAINNENNDQLEEQQQQTKKRKYIRKKALQLRKPKQKQTSSFSNNLNESHCKQQAQFIAKQGQARIQTQKMEEEQEKPISSKHEASLHKVQQSQSMINENEKITVEKEKKIKKKRPATQNAEGQKSKTKKEEHKCVPTNNNNNKQQKNLEQNMPYPNCQKEVNQLKKELQKVRKVFDQNQEIVRTLKKKMEQGQEKNNLESHQDYVEFEKEPIAKKKENQMEVEHDQQKQREEHSSFKDQIKNSSEINNLQSQNNQKRRGKSATFRKQLKKSSSQEYRPVDDEVGSSSSSEHNAFLPDGSVKSVAKKQKKGYKRRRTNKQRLQQKIKQQSNDSRVLSTLNKEGDDDFDQIVQNEEQQEKSDLKNRIAVELTPNEGKNLEDQEKSINNKNNENTNNNQKQQGKQKRRRKMTPQDLQRLKQQRQQLRQLRERQKQQKQKERLQKEKEKEKERLEKEKEKQKQRLQKEKQKQKQRQQRLMKKQLEKQQRELLKLQKKQSQRKSKVQGSQQKKHSKHQSGSLQKKSKPQQVSNQGKRQEQLSKKQKHEERSLSDDKGNKKNKKQLNSSQPSSSCLVATAEYKGQHSSTRKIQIVHHLKMKTNFNKEIKDHKLKEGSKVLQNSIENNSTKEDIKVPENRNSFEKINQSQQNQSSNEIKQLISKNLKHVAVQEIRQRLQKNLKREKPVVSYSQPSKQLASISLDNHESNNSHLINTQKQEIIQTGPHKKVKITREESIKYAVPQYFQIDKQKELQNQDKFQQDCIQIHIRQISEASDFSAKGS